MLESWNSLIIRRLISASYIYTSTTNMLVQTSLSLYTGVPQIQGLPPGVCIQPFSPTTITSPGHQPTYLIPKTLLQQQIAASAGNQPARVFTIKPANIAPTGKLLIPEQMVTAAGTATAASALISNSKTVVSSSSVSTQVTGESCSYHISL